MNVSKEKPVDVVEGEAESKDHWERGFLLFSSLSQKFFIRIHLSLEFEDLHSQLVRTPILKKKLRIYVNSQASVGSVYPPLRARDSLPGGYDSLCRRFGRGIKKKQPHYASRKEEKGKTHKILFCTLVCFTRGSGLVLPCSPHSLPWSLTGRCRVIGCIF